MISWDDVLERWTYSGRGGTQCQSATGTITSNSLSTSTSIIKKTSDFPIKKVIFNGPATIVIWNDGCKTIVKCSENDTYDREKGLAIAIAKYCFGNNGKLKSIFKKFLKDE